VAWCNSTRLAAALFEDVTQPFADRYRRSAAKKEDASAAQDQPSMPADPSPVRIPLTHTGGLDAANAPSSAAAAAASSSQEPHPPLHLIPHQQQRKRLPMAGVRPQLLPKRQVKGRGRHSVAMAQVEAEPFSQRVGPKVMTAGLIQRLHDGYLKKRMTEEVEASLAQEYGVEVSMVKQVLRHSLEGCKEDLGAFWQVDRMLEGGAKGKATFDQERAACEKHMAALQLQLQQQQQPDPYANLYFTDDAHSEEHHLRVAIQQLCERVPGVYGLVPDCVAPVREDFRVAIHTCLHHWSRHVLVETHEAAMKAISFLHEQQVVLPVLTFVRVTDQVGDPDIDSKRLLPRPTGDGVWPAVQVCQFHTPHISMFFERLLFNLIICETVDLCHQLAKSPVYGSGGWLYVSKDGHMVQNSYAAAHPMQQQLHPHGHHDHPPPHASPQHVGAPRADLHQPDPHAHAIPPMSQGTHPDPVAAHSGAAAAAAAHPGHAHVAHHHGAAAAAAAGVSPMGVGHAAAMLQKADLVPLPHG